MQQRSRAVPNILVADDNPVTLRFFSEALAQLGLGCELANDGIEAVQRCARASFDLVLLDARMPGLDGIQALVRIRAESGPSRNAVAVATTADTSEPARRDLIAAGFVDVIVKPVSIGSLRGALAQHLPALAEETAGDRERFDPARLDDEYALAAVGGDASILAALRGLLVAELDALPAEVAALIAHDDAAAMRDRLHRLDASAGFCGAPGLVHAAATLRAAFDPSSGWPRADIDAFLDACARVRAQIAAAGTASR